MELKVFAVLNHTEKALGLWLHLTMIHQLVVVSSCLQAGRDSVLHSVYSCMYETLLLQKGFIFIHKIALKNFLRASSGSIAGASK